MATTAARGTQRQSPTRGYVGSDGRTGTSTAASAAAMTEQDQGAADEDDKTPELLRVIRAAIDAAENHLVLICNLSQQLDWGTQHRHRRGKLIKFLKKHGFRTVSHPANRHSVGVTYGGGGGSAAGADAAGAVDTTRLATPILVVHTTREYKEMARRHVTAADVVLEVGCAEGLTTKLIAGLAKDVVGIDLSSKEISRARARFPELELHVMDGLDFEAMRALRPGVRFNKVFVDVSGTRSLANLLPVVECVEKRLRPQLMVVKSVHLNELKEKLLAGTRVGTRVATANSNSNTAGDRQDAAAAPAVGSEEVARIEQAVLALEAKHTDVRLPPQSPAATADSGGEGGSGRRGLAENPRCGSFPDVLAHDIPPSGRAASQQHEPLPGSLPGSPALPGSPQGGTHTPTTRTAGACAGVPLTQSKWPPSPERASVYALEPKYQPQYYPMPPMNAQKAIQTRKGLVERCRALVQGGPAEESLLPTALQTQRTCLDLQATIAPNERFVVVVTPRIVEMSMLPGSPDEARAHASTGRPPAGFASVSLDRLRASLGLALLEEHGNRPGPPPHVAQLTALALADGGFPTYAPLLCSWNAQSSVFACAQGAFVYLVILQADRDSGAPLPHLPAQTRVVLLPKDEVCAGLAVLGRTPSGRVSLAVCLRSGTVGVATCTASTFSKTFEIRENGSARGGTGRAGVLDATAAAAVAAYSYESAVDEEVVFEEGAAAAAAAPQPPTPRRVQNMRRRSSIGSHKLSRLHVHWRTVRLPTNGMQRVDYCALALAPADDGDEAGSPGPAGAAPGRSPGGDSTRSNHSSPATPAYNDAAEVLVVAAGGPLANPSRPEQVHGELSAVAVVAVRGLHAGSSGRLLSGSHRASVQTQHVLGFTSSAAALAEARTAVGAGSWAGSVLGRFSARWRALPPGLVPLTRVSFSPCGRYLMACDLAGDVQLWRMLASGLAPASVYRTSRALDAFWTAGGNRLGVLTQSEPTARQAAVRFFDLAPATTATAAASTPRRGVAVAAGSGDGDDDDDDLDLDTVEDRGEATADRLIRFVEHLHRGSADGSGGVAIRPAAGSSSSSSGGNSVVLGDDTKLATLPFDSAFQLAHHSGANGANPGALDQVVLLEITAASATGASEGDGESLGRRPSASELPGPVVAAAVRVRVARAMA